LTDKCPHCGENITAQASEELQEIFDNLEEALVGLKSGNNVRENKAIVERFARKAKMYYGSNPKIQKLLEEVENELSIAEKRASKDARNNAFVNFITDPRIVLLIELLICAFLFYGNVRSCDNAEKRRNLVWNKIQDHPDYEESIGWDLYFQYKDKSPEYIKLVREYKSIPESNDYSSIGFCIIFGGFLIMFFSYQIASHFKKE
jgi:hypothetical protein